MNPETDKLDIADPQKVAILQQAWLTGELTIQRSLTYLQKPAKLGSVFYLIKYETSERLVYAGAYEIKLDLEDHLVKKDQLTLYIVHELSKQL